MSSAPRIRTGITQGLGLVALPVGLERHESGYRESDPGPHLGKVMRCHYATSAWSLPGESNPDRLRTREACCRCHQAGTSWRPTIRTWTTRAKTSRAAVTPAAIVSPPPVPTRASFPYKGTPDAGPEGVGTLGEIRTHTAHRLGVVPPAVLGYERSESLQQVSNLPPAAYGAAALPDELWRHGLPGKDSNLDSLGQSQLSCR
jgi:hypothetical protein